MKNKLYAAYGSNLNLPQMKQRCPTATVVGTAKLKNHELVFRTGRYSAVATVEPCEGKSVPILLWNIKPNDEKSLDIYEGAPRFYRQEMMDFEQDGNTVSAMIYIMNDGPEYGEPSERYLNTIRQGYVTAGFDENILDEAVEHSAEMAEDTDITGWPFNFEYDDFD